MNVGDDEHITDLPLIAATATREELIEHLFRLENWRRSREPAADGGILPKFVRWRDLVNAGLVTYSNGEINAGGDVFRPVTPVVSVDEGGGTLLLTVDRFPFFSFPTATSHVAQAPGETMLTFTAKLLNLTGTATWTAEAFDARSGGASLGTFALGTTSSGNVRTMTAAQFVSIGVSGSVRRVRVTATLGSDGASDFIDVFRQDPSTTEPFLFLSNPSHAVQTDENGENGNYADAFTHAAVFEGITDTTADWTFTITPDTGVDATINGGPGPLANPPTVTVAVSDMDVPTGIVQVKATQAGETDLTADFLLDKQEASATGYTAFFTPRREIQLPINDSGVVTSYADAWSDVKIVKNGAIDDTASWTLTKEDVNVTSTLVGTRVTVTALLSLGSFSGATVSVTLPFALIASSINYLYDVQYGGGVWIALGYNGGGGSPTTWSKVLRSTDFITWTAVDVGDTASWQFLTYDQGAWVLVRGGVSNTHKIRRSTDGGLTWSEVTMPTTPTRQWYSIYAGGGKIMLASIGVSGGTEGAFSTNGGASWSSYTWFTDTVTILALSAALSFVRTSTGQQWISTNHGVSWTNDDANWPTDCFDAIVYKGRLVASIWDSVPRAKYRDPGGSWVTVALPHNISLGRLQIVSGVLYMLTHASGGSTPVYTTDGATWKACSGGASGYSVRGGQDQVDVEFFPSWSLGGNQVHRRALQANSDTDGAVVVAATKPGALDIELTLPVLKGTAQRDTYLFQAQPAYLVLPATADGVVTNFAAGVMNFYAQKNGINDTANWTWTWTTTNLTPASGTGSTVTLTGMSQSQDTGFITVTFSKPGQAVRTETLVVQKIRGDVPAGPRVGGAYAAVTTTTTHIALRFNLDGRVQQQNTSGGPWLDLTTWAGRVHPTENQVYWIKVIPDPGSHALTSGTENTFLAMTSNRDFVMSDASPAPHTYRFTVVLATSSGGANPIIAFGSMTILPP